MLQCAHTCLASRTDQPTLRSPDGRIGIADGSDDKPLGSRFDHVGTPARRTALAGVAAETGATPNQVVLSWLIGSEMPVIPLVGASSVAQLDETLAAATLELTADQRAP